jgi:hypothetical protein
MISVGDVLTIIDRLIEQVIELATFDAFLSSCSFSHHIIIDQNSFS